ncbi:snurportin-1 isoform X2 [Epargyreus clarus]|uniref:snurportin-1 isoform X2 n=1 Tax=Epargyreus clarus TaxID=520877 RepID=UPI003C2C34DC
MDEMLELFDNTLGTEPDDSFKSLYKNWGKFGNQEQRRSEILKQQKSNRRNNLDSCRGILNLMETAREKDGIFKRPYQGSYKPNVYVPGFTKASTKFQDILMLSEWLIEKPEDFSTSWYVTPCPKGTRVLVIACNGNTKCYTKFGQFLFATSTMLPGGNHQESRNKCSALDCFYVQDCKTMYVLDVLSWNNHVMADGEMEFRNFWLKTKFNEEPALKKLTKRNKLIFNLLPMVPCNYESLQEFMMTYPPLLLAKLDGLLFYHKEGHYVPGQTPLVGWLFPFMVPEVLGSDISIHESYAAGKPKNYVDQATYIQNFEEKARKKKSFGRNRRGRSESKSESTMEAEDCPDGAKGNENETVAMDANTNGDNKEPQENEPEAKMEAEQCPQLPHVDTILEAETIASQAMKNNEGSATMEAGNGANEVTENTVKVFFSYFENK